jgi:3-oxoacyl-(acyl-carrier-protein) synthase
METIAERVAPLVNSKKIRRLGSTAVEQVMASGVSARLSGILALGNQVTTNSSACSTGTEAIIEGLYRIRSGRAERMMCGGAEAGTRYIWAGFDAMRVLARNWNDRPEEASRPMSASAGGFVPGAGAGALLLESLDAAEARGATVFAEVLGGAVNCGGHRSGGSMTAPNPAGVTRCIQAALVDAQVTPDAIDLISGHLTATSADPREVAAWTAALGRPPEDFPTLLSTKSLIGHTLGAAGAIESIAGILMLGRDFVHPSINCEDIHPEIAPYEASIPREPREGVRHDVMIKSSFGFGDVNACVLFRRWND